MSISFSNPPQKNIHTEIRAGIKVNDMKYTCVGYVTGKELPSDKCFFGDKESGIEYGFNKISGSLASQDKSEVYSILQSFFFLRF